MNRTNDLVPSDYSLIYSCVIKYQSVLLDKRRTKSIHCLVNLDDFVQLKQNNKLIKSNSSLLNQSFGCDCCAIHFSSTLREQSSTVHNTHQFENSPQNTPKNIVTNQKFNYSPLLNQQALNATKTASTSILNSKLKGSSNRLTTATTGHRMPNSNSINSNKNATNSNQHSSTNKSNEKLQTTTNQTNKQQTSTNQAKRITDQAIQLLAEDVESRLEALLRTFIQEEKLRQEARYNSLMGKRSASLNALNSVYADTTNQEMMNSDYLPMSRYNQQSNKATNFGFIKPQHQMKQSYQLHNSQTVNTPQKSAGIKTSSHRLDSSPSRSNTSTNNSLQNSKAVTSRTRSPSPNSRQSSSPQPSSTNLYPVNRNNLFGQHQRTDQNNKQTASSSSNKQPTTYLNLHQRSQSPTKDNQPIKSSQLVKQQQQHILNNQSIGHSSHHRIYSPNQSKFYDPFSTNSSQFGRSKDDSHIRRVVVYNLNKDAASVEKKPIIIEGSKNAAMNGTLNNGYVQQQTKSAANVTSTGEKIGTTNDNQAIRLRSAKTRTNSPSRVGSLLNGNNIVGSNNTVGESTLQSKNNILKQQQTNNSLATGRIAALSNTSPANTNKLLTSSNLNNNTSNTKKLSSTATGKVTNTNSNRLTTGHESSLQQFKDHNNLDSMNVGVGTAAQQLNTAERKVVRKVIVKELDGPRSESVVNSSSNLSNKPKTYQQQRLSPISNGDLNSVAKMATLNAPQQPVLPTNLNNQVSSLDALLSERDRILNNRDQYKQLRNNVLSDANNNYILSKTNNKFNTSSNSDLSSSSNSSSSAAGLLNSTSLNNVNQSTNRNLPLSSSAAKRKPLIDRYSPFSIVNEARQRFEETVKNGMNGQIASRFNCLDNKEDYLKDVNDLIFNETYEQPDEELVDSSMVLIRSKLHRMLNTNGNVISDLPNSAIFSLLNHLSNNKTQNESLPACLADLNKSELLLNTSHNTSFSDESLSSSTQLYAPKIAQSLTSATTAINSMRPPLMVTTNSSDSNGHPTITGQSNGQYSASQNRPNTVKPFLSKGSVAERVMLFEKHPQLKQIVETEAANRKEESAIMQRVYKTPVPYSAWRKNEVINLSTSFEQNLKGKPPLSKQQNLQESLPKFYFPHGKPQTNSQHLDQITKQVNQFFKTLKDGICLREHLIELCKASNFPIYWKEPLFLMLAQNNQISHDSYLTFWRRLIGNYFDEASKFVFILSKGKRNCLLPEDFIPMIQDVINSHPGLLFLKHAFEFHSRYVHTVIARIYYCVNRSWSGRISINELRRSNFLQIVKLLQDEDDINQITDYFSYEHFYVIYCKFWGLDKDHDLIIDKYDLSRHNDGAISSRMIDRIFSGAVTQSKSKSKQMTYQEFVFFLISEEDKKTDTAIEYWFRCLDLDGDGFLSLYELEYFYDEQVRRMESIGIEALPFADCICQMLDMINPEQTNKISLSDLKKCSMTYIFLDTFFNLHKYLLHEQKDPFSNKDDQLESDWNKFAAEEYNLLVAEEQQMLVDDNEQENTNQQKYMTFVYDDENEFRINPYQQREYDDYDTTDQEDYDYLLTDEEY